MPGRHQCQASVKLDWVNIGLQSMRTSDESHLQEQISNAEVAVHAGNHEGRAEVALDAVHIHLQPRSQLGHNVQVAHASCQDQGCESVFVG